MYFNIYICIYYYFYYYYHCIFGITWLYIIGLGRVGPLRNGSRDVWSENVFVGMGHGPAPTSFGTLL